ncbi:HNH endonuclease [Vibrio alginolyticus]|uniref:HNH endonuclease n=1 Tax=Vibrio alginolyticus TaxID=663 RepID=UPI001BD50ECF|nr:HNH endonuclease [Vibrio alginolyticus]MBS9810605.1 HNH endonuclease [Vibrio alginolyticus]HCH3308205.1 HNH endonuclease [Vibrio parahaemolyticus]
MITKEQVQEIYIDQNKTLKETAEILSCSPSTVGLAAKKYGLRKKKPYSFHKPTREEVKELYIDKMMTRNQLADHFGLSCARISKLITEYKLTAKDLGLGEKKGQTAWNKGLTKDSDERVAKISESMSGDKNPGHGKAPWNSGLTKDNDERVKSVSEGRKGIIFSDEQLKKMRLAKLGKCGEQANNWQGGKTAWYKYPTTTRNGKKMYTHRAVAEDILGIVLTPTQHVHHIDRDKTNNDPSNLIVLLNSVHSALHSAIKSNSAEEQIEWLKSNDYEYVWLKDYLEDAA